MPALKFCGECNNLLYPKSDNNAKVLLYQCRNCNYTENATIEPGMAGRVYKHDLLTVAREQPGETKDLDTDPALQRSSIECPACHHHGAVFYQDQGRRITTNMTLFYSCINCKNLFRDPNIKHR
ncbi:DNA-directed RNA polymerase II subunit RPB9 [Cryptococcus wingfieldii CBS 7118]|uniref:DNA-directed RNA polymerase subunit n=1 Tax=Cryptococcus wingfieldii CBS 7118 TaxID=1295528 RepID=A0A1E3K1Y6_9TREE|nr:DNA-directed RNA polymerase II subunit RPB9 [Cryptococcus wingfieldii CBS 7118]ODO06212.1 DNA-directed RNA polymerase II subunit RPB9 [Cryptococcus wingfieldii CBS 7118]